MFSLLIFSSSYFPFFLSLSVLLSLISFNCCFIACVSFYSHSHAINTYMQSHWINFGIGSNQILHGTIWIEYMDIKRRVLYTYTSCNSFFFLFIFFSSLVDQCGAKKALADKKGVFVKTIIASHFFYVNRGKHCTKDKKKPVHILSHLFGLCFHQASDDLFQTDWWFSTTIFHFVLSSKRHDYRLNCLHNRINNSVNKSNKCSIKKSYRITLSLYLFIQQNCKLFSMLKNIKIEKWSLFVHTQIVSRYVWPKRTICAIVAAAISNSIIHICSYFHCYR